MISLQLVFVILKFRCKIKLFLFLFFIFVENHQYGTMTYDGRVTGVELEGISGPML